MRGIINPLNIEEYIGRNGYMGLAKALTEMTPDQVVNEIVQSGLREEGVVVFRRGSNGDSLNRHRVM